MELSFLYNCAESLPWWNVHITCKPSHLNILYLCAWWPKTFGQYIDVWSLGRLRGARHFEYQLAHWRLSCNSMEYDMKMTEYERCSDYLLNRFIVRNRLNRVSKHGQQWSLISWCGRESNFQHQMRYLLGQSVWRFTLNRFWAYLY